MEQNLEHFKGQNILITGGGGYLGAKLAEKLKASEANLYLFDKKFNDLAKSLSVKYQNIKLVEVNLTKKHQLKEAIQSAMPDYIFHFAALLQRERDFSFFPDLYEVNVNGTLNLLEALKEIPYKGFYYSSSSEVYGTKNTSPFNEGQIPAPASPYSLSKIMAEQLLQTFSDIYQKPYTILRIFNFYGQGMPESFFINQLISTLTRDEYFKMTGGGQVRDFIHIDLLLAAIIGISKSEKSNGEIVNISSGLGTKLKELAIEIACKLNKKHLLRIGVLPYRENEVWEMVGSNEKLKKYISFSLLINARNDLYNSLFD